MIFYPRQYGNRPQENWQSCHEIVALRESETGAFLPTEEGVSLDGFEFHEWSSNITQRMVSLQGFKDHSGNFSQGGAVDTKYFSVTCHKL